jgi:hypothetical protein
VGLRRPDAGRRPFVLVLLELPQDVLAGLRARSAQARAFTTRAAICDAGRYCHRRGPSPMSPMTTSMRSSVRTRCIRSLKLQIQEPDSMQHTALTPV